MIKKTYRITILTTLIFLLIVITTIPIPLAKNSGTYVHLSFDDVELCLKDLSKNSNIYHSIFENHFFAYLKKLHDFYDAKFTLYTYLEESNGFSIENMPRKYKQEFKDCSSWLKFGFHAQNSSIKKDSIAQYLRFTDSYRRVNESIENFAGKECISNVLRLHYFYATQQEIQFLAKEGVLKLLSSDDGRNSYSLSYNLNKKLIAEETLRTYNMQYERTDIRLENTIFPNISLLQNINEPFLVIFTHEWAFNNVNKQKLEYILWRLSFENVKYIN